MVYRTQGSAGPVDEAVNMIREYLPSHGGHAKRGQVIEQAKLDGHDPSVVKTAACMLGLPTGRGGRKVWHLPPRND